ncbi:MAG TPA: MBL fold metallo-hydrolase [Chloroflexi bacterium]|nr:MAG: MBL fold metallo-hydrolase [Chloroflexota bacterium]HDD56239.1 MBL fold metallo-hydrolase [Chloroflexota bacterium]
MNKARVLNQGFWVAAAGIFLAAFLSSCGPGLIKADNPLIKADPTATATVPPPPATDPPLPTATATEEVRPAEMIRITIVYDNYPYKAGLGTAWGFSAYITHKDENILFDTGGSGSLLLSNLAALKIKPGGIQNVVLSHEHNDHTGGLQHLLSSGTDPNLYIPPSFSSGFKNQFRTQTQIVEVSPGLQIAEGMYTIGEMPGPPPEQGLVIKTSEGLIVITGCAHPGVEKMVSAAKRQFQEDIYLVLGGFHLGSASDTRINQIIAEFQRLGVKHVAPCHCTGDRAIGMFRNAFGEDFIPVGVGAVISVEG